jgi:hypothetical protein
MHNISKDPTPYFSPSLLYESHCMDYGAYVIKLEKYRKPQENLYCSAVIR